MKSMRNTLVGLSVAGLIASATQAASTTYLLDFGGNGAVVYQSSDTANGEINLLQGSANGTGFNIDQIVPIISPAFGPGSGTIGETYSVGAYTLTTNTTYGTWNLGGASATSNSSLYSSFFLTTGATPVRFQISGLNPTDVVSIGFMHSQPWNIVLSASTTSDFSSNVIGATSTGVVGPTSPFTSVSGTLTGSSTVYFSFVSTGGGEGDLSGLVFNVTSSAIPEPSAFAAASGAAGLLAAGLRRRRRAA